MSTCRLRSPDEYFVRSMNRAYLLAKLGEIRKTKISPDTFRRWRKIANIKNRCWYNSFDYTKLSLVAQHLALGGQCVDPELRSKIQRLEALEQSL